jgi:hypothetical protein
MSSKAWMRGYWKGYKGSDEPNPHALNTLEYKEWNIGYEEGRLDKLAER